MLGAMLRAVADDNDALARTVDDACARGRRAQEAFASTKRDARAALLRQLRAAMLRRAEELIALLVDESAKVRAEAIALELIPAALSLGFVAHEGPRALRGERVAPYAPLPRLSTRHFRPLGVCGLITPFNYTLAIPMASLAAALMAGNAVVWKPAESGARVARKLVEIFESAGLPRDLVVVVEGGPEMGRALVDGPIDHLTFVGSTDAGRRVAARCGERLLPSILELGGKAPAIVLDDADLDRTSRALVFGGLANGGQSCVAVERVYAVPSVFDELVARTSAVAEKVKPGVDVMALEARQEKHVAALVQDAKARGARFHGAVVDVTGIPDARMLHEEVFGPLLPFVRVTDADEGVRLANAHPQQLVAYAFTEDRARGRALARKLRAPHVVVNDVMTSYAMMELPFGGQGASGWGRVHGVEGIRSLAREQIVVDGKLPLVKEPWWLPYDARMADFALRHLERVMSWWDRKRW
jgi:succinate-semialdehyde dehydrogenase/glutarate-semialdehyde dehydrogenase